MHQFFKVPMMNGAEWQNVLMMANTPNLRPQRKYQKWQWRDMARNVTWWKGERLVAGQVAKWEWERRRKVCRQVKKVLTPSSTLFILTALNVVICNVSQLIIL